MDASEKFQFRSFYLIKGSTLHVDGCLSDNADDNMQMEFVLIEQGDSPSQANVMVLKGWRNFQAWKRLTADRWDGHWNDLLAFRNLTSSHKNNGSCKSQAINEVVKKSGKYYVVLTNPSHTRFKGHVHIHVKRTFYNIEHVENACFYDPICSFQLDFNKNYDVIVYIRNDVDHPSKTSLISTACVPRTSFWFAVFGVTLLAIFVTSSIFAFTCLRKKRRTGSKSKNRPAYSRIPVASLNKALEGDVTLSLIDEVRPKNLHVMLSEKELAKILK